MLNLILNAQCQTQLQFPGRDRDRSRPPADVDGPRVPPQDGHDRQHIRAQPGHRGQPHHVAATNVPNGLPLPTTTTTTATTTAAASPSLHVFFSATTNAERRSSGLSSHKSTVEQVKD